MSSAQRIFSPIYTHLDNDNPSRALKECEQVLKKITKKGAIDKEGEVWLTTNVLKAIAFQRLNRVEEALQAAAIVCEAQPSDETILQMLANVYRDLDRPEMMCPVYENALKTNESEEVYTHTFMAFLRSSDYGKLKQIGGKLFQKYQKYPYLYWTAMAGFLQAKGCSDERMKKMNLEIAKRTIQKNLEGIETERQVKLYLMILQELEDWETMSAAVEKYEKLFTETLFCFDQFQMRAWEATSQPKMICRRAMERVEADPDDIGAWKLLIKTWFRNQKAVEDELDIVGLFTKLMGTEKQNTFQFRGPDLAKFMFSESSCYVYWGSCQQMIEDYCLKWKKKSSTVFDMELYAEGLMTKEKAAIIEKLIEEDDEVPFLFASKLPKTLKELDAYCAAHLLPYQLALSWGVDKYITKNNSKMLESMGSSLYEMGKETPIIQELMDTEGRPWDRHFLVAALMVLRKDQSRSSIIRALAILDRGIKSTGTCPDLLLLSLNLYARLDCINEAIKLFRTHLDMKSIQNDSLGYVIFPHVFQLNPEAASDLLDNPLTFFANSKKDTTEAVIKCFREGNFAQVEDISKFRDALKNSIMRKLLQVENLVTSGYYGKKLLSELSDSNASDNRDFDALNWWGPDRKSRIRELKKRSFDDLEHYIRFRTGCLEFLQGSEKDLDELEKLAVVKPFEDSEISLISGYHKMPSTLPRKVTIMTLKLLKYFRNRLVEKTGVRPEVAQLEKYRRCLRECVAGDELRSRWFIIESVMFLLNFVKSNEQSLMEIKKGGKKIPKATKEVFAQFVDLSDYLCCDQIRDGFMGDAVGLDSLSLDEDVSEIASRVKNDQEEVRLTLNEMFTKYSSNLSRQLAKK